MLIIKIFPNEDGSHTLEAQSHRQEVWMDGYIEAPTHLYDAIDACSGYCDLIIENNVLVGIVAHENQTSE